MTYDAILIGAGHNGLVAAALLAQAGLKVLVLEQRQTLGGTAATEEIFPGFKVNTGATDVGLFRPEILKALELKKYGLTLVESSVAAFAPQPDGRALTLWRDPAKCAAEIARFSAADVEKAPAFLRLVQRSAEILHGTMLLTPPDLADLELSTRSLTRTPPGEFLPWLGLGLKLRSWSKSEMMEFLRVLPMSAAEFLDEWFESPALKGLLGSSGIIGSMLGPRGAGSTFLFLYHYLGAPSGLFRASRFALGGVGELIRALAAAARRYGAEIRTGAEVARVLVKEDQATGIALANGDEFTSRIVLSNADPRRTFFHLVGAQSLEPRFTRLVENIRYRGVTARVNLALSGLPHFSNRFSDRITALSASAAPLSGHILISPSLDYLERAYDDAKYGRFSQAPYLDVVIPSILDSSLAPPQQHVLSITMQYAPYHLRESDWDSQREALGDYIVNTLAQYAPDLPNLILHRQVLTPMDWEHSYGLTEGDIFHGQMALDQLLFMRPVAGYAQYRTPIRGLYLCSAGAHPGGGVTGAPGYNAAREVLRELKRGKG